VPDKKTAIAILLSRDAALGSRTLRAVADYGLGAASFWHSFRVADITGQSLLTSQGYGVCAFR
jgi:hypothetical protein